MKPKDLKCPFTWETRQPLLSDRVFYVPEYYTQHTASYLPPLEEIFGRKAPLEIEYCSGNGAWIIEKALAHPEKDWIAVELQFDRARKIWSKMHNLGAKNLLVVCGEGLTFTRHYIQEALFHAIYINFPDPWPKERHAKNRLLQEPFIEELSRVSLGSARLTLVTDHLPYAASAIEALQASLAWTPTQPAPHYLTEYPGYGDSYFGELWKERGLEIRYIQYDRVLR